MGECLEVEGDTSDTLPQTEMHLSNFLNGSNSETKNENDMSVCNANKGVSEKLSKSVNTSKDAVIGGGGGDDDTTQIHFTPYNQLVIPQLEIEKSVFDVENYKLSKTIEIQSRCAIAMSRGLICGMIIETTY